MASINNCTALHLIAMWTNTNTVNVITIQQTFWIFLAEPIHMSKDLGDQVGPDFNPIFLLPNIRSLPALGCKCRQTILPQFHWHEWTMAKRGAKSGPSPPIWVVLHVMQKTIMSPFLLANMSQSPKKGKSLPFKVISVLCNCIWELFHFCAFQCQS